MAGATKIIEMKTDLLTEMCRNYEVRRLSLFGSGATDDFDENMSDLDFLVEFSEPPTGMRLGAQFFEFLRELEQLFGRHVDLLEDSALENSRLRKSAADTAVIVYAA